MRGGVQQKVTSLYRGGHQKVTLGDMGGGRGQKSQKRGDIICVRPPSAEFTLCRIIIFWILLCKDLLLVK